MAGSVECRAKVRPASERSKVRRARAACRTQMSVPSVHRNSTSHRLSFAKTSSDAMRELGRPRRLSGASASHHEDARQVKESYRRAMPCKGPWHSWHSWQPWQCRICKLQILQGVREFESHPLCHNKINHLREIVRSFFVCPILPRTLGYDPVEAMSRTDYLHSSGGGRTGRRNSSSPA